ncbi:MAG TPA: SOS response-associated peptidase [Candidatus Methylomirabilis sp.]|nr:SOS response-associated peptidase [Candidatus Methylomirabilis sp.]
MCGRFSLGASAATLASHFNVQETLARTGRYNIAPTQDVLTLVQPAGAGRQLRRMRWGLIPAWAKDPAIGNQLMNARAETIAIKPAFRKSLRERRCLILTDGFYEWEAQGRRKQPWFIRMRDGHPFAFAGLWDGWRDPEGRHVESCTIITTTPNDLIQRFHHRMPVILPAKDYDLWLDPQIRDVDRLLPLLLPYSPEEMTAHPVSPLVNNPANDSPACQSPTE